MCSVRNGGAILSWLAVTLSIEWHRAHLLRTLWMEIKMSEFEPSNCVK